MKRSRELAVILASCLALPTGAMAQGASSQLETAAQSADSGARWADGAPRLGPTDLAAGSASVAPQKFAKFAADASAWQERKGETLVWGHPRPALKKTSSVDDGPLWQSAAVEGFWLVECVPYAMTEDKWTIVKMVGVYLEFALLPLAVAATVFGAIGGAAVGGVQWLSS